MPSQAPTPGRRVFVAVDEAPLRWSIERHLAARGFAVTAADGASAATLLAAPGFDVLIAGMPPGGAEGLALAAEARRLRPETQVIVVGGEGSKDTVLTALRLGVADYLEKPVDLEQLRLAAERALERSRVLRELVQLSRTDGLTGLFNQRHFHAALEAEAGRARRQGRPLALLLFDVDDFKVYNDRFGHLAGDAALARIADCLKQACRRDTDSAFRIGGDEFVLLLPEADAATAGEIAARARALLAEEGVSLTLSVGAAELRDGQDPRALVRDADEAMYRAKRGDARGGTLPRAV